MLTAVRILRIIKIVMQAHYIECDLTRLLELNQFLDHRDIAVGADYFDDPDVKEDSMRSDVEDQLMKHGFLFGAKQFFVREEDDCKGMYCAANGSKNRASGN